jgi:hypothetical protein
LEANRNQVSRAEAIAFLNEVRNRAAGKIEREEIKRFLFAINHYRDPASEWNSKRLHRFSSKNEEKAKGLEVSINIPVSWEERLGTTPNALRTWVSEAGTGSSTIGLLIVNTDDQRSRTDIQRAISAREFKGLVPSSSKIESVSTAEVSDQPGWLYEIEMVRKRVDLEFFMRFKSLNVLYKGKRVELNCSSGGAITAQEEVRSEFKRLEKICRLVMNSLVIDSVYK